MDWTSVGQACHTTHNDKTSRAKYAKAQFTLTHSRDCGRLFVVQHFEVWLSQRLQDDRGRAAERAKVKNFLVHYEIDQETVKTVLRLEEYDGHDDMSWVLLDAIGGGAGSSERVVPGSCV